MTVGQQAAATHQDTRNYIPILQVGNTERKAHTEAVKIKRYAIIFVNTSIHFLTVL